MTSASGATSGGSDAGERLAGAERRLRLLLAHLASPALRARVELDDLVQEVFVRALTAPGGLPPREPDDAALGRWLATLARHAVIDAARALRAAKRDGRVRRLDRSEWSRVGAAASGIAAPGSGPATRASARESEARLLASFAGLDPEHRRVIGLRQLQGLSAREAARRMGRSETAVHSLYRRALAAWERSLSESAGSRGESAGERRSSSP
jgi:RNA polymerase sigma-70 factor (ECF subfamily)